MPDHDASQAILAGALTTTPFDVKAVQAPGSLLFCRESIRSFQNNPYSVMPLEGCVMTPMLSLPGFLPWGDVSLAAALARKGGHAVSFEQPCASDGTPYTAAQAKALQREITRLEEKIWQPSSLFS